MSISFISSEEFRPEISDHPIDVDIRLYGAEDVPKMVEAGHDLITWSLRFGYLVCQHSDYWSQLRRTWEGKTPLPNPEVAEERALKTARVYEDLRRIGDDEAAGEQLISLLTHKAWAVLLRRGVPPASRPELPALLRSIGQAALAESLEKELRRRASETRGAVVLADR